MQKILDLLNSSVIVHGYEVLDFKQGEFFSYLKLKAGFGVYHHPPRGKRNIPGRE